VRDGGADVEALMDPTNDNDINDFRHNITFDLNL
jgi:hypothetical protein